MKSITELKRQIESLTSRYYLMIDPRVTTVLAQIEKENAPVVAGLQKQLAELKSKRKPTLRWPANTPEEILKLCRDYWSGTEEHRTFRIHQWNDKAVWTSYPAGGYSCVAGFVPTAPAYHLVSRTERESGNRMTSRPTKLKDIAFERNSGKRVTPAMMKEELDKL